MKPSITTKSVLEALVEVDCFEGDKTCFVKEEAIIYFNPKGIHSDKDFYRAVLNEVFREKFYLDRKAAKTMADRFAEDADVGRYISLCNYEIMTKFGWR